MNEYKTVEEMADEWGVTARYVQHLCRTERIEGAIKRVGAWFIPADAPNPVKQNKSNNKPFKFVGTKKKIFDNAVALFARNGYENVSVKDIAKAIGIRPSAVYNHYKSKQEILDTMYDYYSYHYQANRSTQANIASLAHSESLAGFITKSFRYAFEEETLTQMTGIIRIIIQRVGTDARATELFRDQTLQGGVRFVEDGLNYAVATGRLAPFDTHTVSVFINSLRLYTLCWWLTNPVTSVMDEVLYDEQTLYNHLARILTDLRPVEPPRA